MAELEKLNKNSKNKFDDIPKDQRAMMTSEGAFKYFAKQFNVKPGYIWEINTEKQGTPGQMKQAIRFVKDNHLKHLLVETSVDKKRCKVYLKKQIKIFTEKYLQILLVKKEQKEIHTTK